MGWICVTLSINLEIQHLIIKKNVFLYLFETAHKQILYLVISAHAHIISCYCCALMEVSWFSAALISRGPKCLRYYFHSSYGLLGPSGCGKTTLLRCILGRLKLAEGHVMTLGRSPGSRGHSVPGVDVGYMPQVGAWRRWQGHIHLSSSSLL